MRINTISKFTPLLAIAVIFGFSQIGSAQGFAVLDIDRAAKELNVEANVKATLDTMEKDLEAELSKTQAEIKAKMGGMLSVVGENPNAEQRQRLIAQIRLLEAEFNQVRAEAAQKIAQKQAEMIQDFADKIKPIAMEQAKKLRKDSVVLKINVFTFESEIDITDATIKAADRAGLKMTEPKS